MKVTNVWIGCYTKGLNEENILVGEDLCYKTSDGTSKSISYSVKGNKVFQLLITLKHTVDELKKDKSNDLSNLSISKLYTSEVIRFTFSNGTTHEISRDFMYGVLSEHDMNYNFFYSKK